MPDLMQADTVWITGHGGDDIEGYLAQPIGDDAPFGSVVVIHHLPGYDEETREIARRFAAHRYIAVCPNLYSREERSCSREEAAAKVRASGGIEDERLVGDVKGAVDFLKGLPTSNGKVATIGYCSGGRQSFLAACRLRLDAAVDCYGAFVVNEPPKEMPLRSRPIVGLAGDLSCPLLGLFGAEDQFPTPKETAVLEEALREAGKNFEFHTYQGAGHAFFAVNRPNYRPEAANDGWDRIWDFFAKHLH